MNTEKVCDFYIFCKSLDGEYLLINMDNNLKYSNALLIQHWLTEIDKHMIKTINKKGWDPGCWHILAEPIF